ncbi:MAG: hypothetical protein QE271_05130 [Bacteriovoracaceae bacterium]|nr:hypothetical protein [Bacteriovoracaceae bacterium]
MYLNIVKIFFSLLELIFVSLLVVMTSCGQNADQTAGNLIFQANLYLGQGKCTEALKSLADVDASKYDFYYYQSLSSAYACQASYKELSFITNFSSIDSSNFFKSLASFSTSRETSATSDGFVKLQKAIHTILYIPAAAGKQNADRVALYGSERGEEISLQALIQILAHLGKYLYYYGNASTAGVKGGGSASSKCFMNYTTATAQTYYATYSSALGACDGTSNGHVDLASGTNQASRVCDLIVNINHLYDILTNITIPNDSRFSSFTDVKTSLVSVKDAAIASVSAGTLTSLFSFYDYESCIAYAEDSTYLSNVELYFLSLLETGLQ